MAWLFQMRGVRALTFASAEDFLNADDPKRRGCVIIDLELPGMSGIELYELLAWRKDPRPVVFLTGDLGSAAGGRALQLRPDHCLQKPIADNDILDMVTKLLAD